MAWRASISRAAIWLLALALGTWASWRALATRGASPVPLAFDAGWVAATDPPLAVAQFRKDLLLPGAVRSAWIAVAADEGFEVVVNGSAAGRSTLWRPTRPFQTGLSERGQRVVGGRPLLDLNFPREYQWEGHHPRVLPAFFDVARFLVPGKNALCVEVATRAPPARVAFEGEVVLWSGERIRIDSGAGLRVAPVPPPDRLWTRADFADEAWPEAVRVEAPRGPVLRVLDPDVYRLPFSGAWLRGPERLANGAIFETTWTLPRDPSEAWIRVLTNRAFQVFVNDRPVRVADSGAQPADGGDWIVGPGVSIDAPASAESLDPDEIGDLFAGSRFDVPASGEGDSSPDATGFAWEATLRGTNLDPGSVRAFDAAPARPVRQGPIIRVPREITPAALSRSQERAVLYAYAVQGLLHEGDNRIAVRLSAPDGPTPPAWSPRLAVDGRASWADGRAPVDLVSDRPWTVRGQAPDGASSPAVEALPSGPASAAGAVLPGMQYRGIADAPDGLVLASLAAFALAVAAIALLSALPWAFGWARSGTRAMPPLVMGPGFVRRATAVLLLPVALLLTAFLVDLSWAERDEVLLLQPATAWRWVLAAAAVLGATSAAAIAFEWRPHRSPLDLWRRLADHRRWPLAVALAVAATGFLRAHALERQPLDDDELASTQAVLAIARTGLPRFGPDVHYTRGPLFHYIAGGLARVLGEHLWALRLPSIFFAMGTALLLYQIGARLLGSRWTGLVAAALFAIHPYAIFVGHLVRFYQQQQFFALASVYFFCLGFVSERSPRARYLALMAFFGACLSQELSVISLVPLGLAFLLFAERGTLRDEWGWWLTACCAGALLVVDILVFQTRCLTKLEGISPNVEATIGLHFMSPLNLAALFVGYSRLHLALTFCLLAAVPLMLRVGPVRGAGMCALAIAVVLFFGVLGTNLLVTGESLRYQYWLLPLWLVLGVHGVRELALEASRASRPGLGADLPGWRAAAVGVLLTGAVFLSWSPWRIPGSYDATLLGDSASAFAYVRSQLRPGDKVAATEPHAHAGVVEIGQIDYDLAVPLLQDFVYRRDGVLVDRNGGAAVISTLAQLRDVVATNDRVWVLVNREKFRSPGQDIRWDYPAAGVEYFLRRNLEVKFQSYLWTVFLWDAGAGKFHTLPEAVPARWGTP